MSIIPPHRNRDSTHLNFFCSVGLNLVHRDDKGPMNTFK